MSSILIRLLILVVLLWLLRRFLAALFGVPERTRPRASGDLANHMVKDPVCGMYMDSRLAFRLDSRKKTVYFCSEKCKTKYLETGREPEVTVEAESPRSFR